MTVFQCKLCPFFFETYNTAVTHLLTKHSIRARNRRSSGGATIGSSCHEELKAISFDRISISIRRVEQSEEQYVVPKKKLRHCNYRTVKSTKNGGVEIQLDSLKASEIETLMKDLYQNQTDFRNPNSKNILSASGEVLPFPSTSRQGSSRRAAALAADAVISNLRNGDVEVDEHNIDTKVANRRKRKTRRIHKDYLPNSEDLNLEKCLLPRKGEKIITERKNADGVVEKAIQYIYEKTYVCDVKGCVRKYVYPQDLQRHNEIHEKVENDITKKYKCPLCHFKFVKKMGLQKHFILHLENNPFVCKFSGCGAKFGSRKSLERHLKLHTGLRPFSCQLCTRSFTRSDSLKKHMKYHQSNKKKRRQPIKRPRTKTINDLAPDAFLGTTNQSFVPKEELEEIRWEVESQHFTDHILLETSDTEKNEDDMESIGLEDFELEERKPTEVHKSAEPHSSGQEISEDNDIDVPPVINQKVDVKKSIRSIILNDPVYQKLLKDDPKAAEGILPLSTKGYNAEEQSFKCTLCDWEGARAFCLQQHMKKLHQKDINCTAFSSTTTTTESNNSVKINLICGFCGYQSSSGTDLSEHTKKEHEIMRKFACFFCGIRFDSVQKKDVHEKTLHLTERKFACSKCPSKYLTSSALGQHEMETHDPECVAKTFRCSICRRELGSRLSLKAHIWSHKNAARVSCKICNQSCSSKHVLKRHIGYVHLNLKNPYHDKSRKKQFESKTKPANMHPNVPPTATTTITDTPEATKCNDIIIGL